jgi:hypothetical protein
MAPPGESATGGAALMLATWAPRWPTNRRGARRESAIPLRPGTAVGRRLL